MLKSGHLQCKHRFIKVFLHSTLIKKMTPTHGGSICTSQIPLWTKPDFHFDVLFVFLHWFATNCMCQTIDPTYFNTKALLYRHCVECQHFKRGQYIADNSCSRICKDEIKVVDLISESLTFFVTFFCILVKLCVIPCSLINIVYF